MISKIDNNLFTFAKTKQKMLFMTNGVTKRFIDTTAQRLRQRERFERDEERNILSRQTDKHRKLKKCTCYLEQPSTPATLLGL